jgi:hypothetical protein
VYSEGDAARDAALDLVAENSGRWIYEARAAVIALPTGWKGTGEDIRLKLSKWGLVPHSPNAWGALINSCIKSGLLEGIDYDKMKDPRSHSRETKVYRRKGNISMNAAATITPEEHSNLVGGSTAGRRIACPASYQMEAKVPESARNSSSPDADEGTLLHECMAYLVTENTAASGVERRLAGRANKTLIDEAILPALEMLDTIIAEIDPDNVGVDILIENRVEMPGVPGAFGTADVIVKGPLGTAIVDWKFGAGVPVSAWYDEDMTMADGRVAARRQPNAQLAFYARGAQHTFPHMFEDDPTWPVSLHIVQPRARTGVPYSKYECNVAELEVFRKRLVAAVEEAQGEAPRIHRGDHCRFAPCKVICPKWTGPALDLTKMHEALQVKKGGLASIRIDWSQMYSELLTLADMAEAVVLEVRKQAHVFMQDGNPVHGYKLVDKRATRKWISDNLAEVYLAETVGLKEDELFDEPKLRSPAQIEKVLKKHGLGMPEDLVHAVSSGTTIAPENDKRENVIQTSGQLMQLSEKLRQIASAK